MIGTLILLVIALCAVVAGVTIVALKKIEIGYKVAKLGISKDAVKAEIGRLETKSVYFNIPDFNGSAPTEREKSYYRMGHERGFECAKREIIGVVNNSRMGEME